MSGPKWVYFFGEGASEGDPARGDVLGGKGASLAAMSRAGLPVPPGFTISIDCCRYYHEHGKHWPEGLEQQIRDHMTHLEKLTARTYGQGARPLLVSVRSGAAVSMPGMMDTLLNCGLHQGLAEQLPDAGRFWKAYVQFVRMFSHSVANIELEDEDESAAGAHDHRQQTLAAMARYEQVAGRVFPAAPWQVLMECINAVFESWNSERALVYRKAQNILNAQGTAVTVQTMFPSEASGIAFTANPSNPLSNEIIIEGAYGLGEAVVSGMVAPDLFVLDHETLQLKSKTLGNKVHSVAALEEPSGLVPNDPAAFALSDDQARDLAQIALNVEKYFGYPVDMEWGLAGGKFAMLQSRGIRGLDVTRDIEVGRQEEIARLRQLAAGKRKVWVVHNLAETLTAPTPMTWDVIRRFMSCSGGYGQLYRDLGYKPGKRVQEEGFLDLICGRIFADPDRAALMFSANMPKEYDLDAVVEDPGLLEAAPTRFDPKRADGTFLMRLGPEILNIIASARKTKKARAAAMDAFECRALPPYVDYVEMKRRENLSAMATQDLIHELHERMVAVMDKFGKESLKPGFFGGEARGKLETMLTALMGAEAARGLVGELTSGLEGDTTVDQNIMLYRVARGEATMDDFLASYGHRTVGEMELAQPRWHEDPSYLEKTIQTYRRPTSRSPEELHSQNQSKRLAAERKLPGILAQWGGSFQEAEIFEVMRRAQKLLPLREGGKHYLMMGYDLIRRVLVELGRRWSLGRDVFFLTLDELPHFERQRDSLVKQIDQRKIRWQSAQRLLLQDVVDSDQLDTLGRPPEVEAANQLEGLPLAPGLVEGEARIIFSVAEADQLPDDCILICPSTDPGWTALFVNLRGLIVDRGGVLSHGAITARDFGIPAIACPQATRRLAGVKRIRIDGSQGIITVLDEK